MNTNTLTDSILARRQKGRVELPQDSAPRLQKLPDIRAVVFDVYGTLFSSGAGDISHASEANRDDALRECLIDSGHALCESSSNVRLDHLFNARIQAHQQRRRTDGIDFPEVEIRSVWRDFIDGLVESGHVKAPSEPADLDLLAVEFEGRVNPVQPMPGLEETLQSLKEKEFTMGIVSNAQFFTPLLFDAFLDGGFAGSGILAELCVWSFELLEAKPSIRLYHDSAGAFSIHDGTGPNEILYIGNDMRNDIWPAQSAGFRTALFAGDRRSLRRRQDDPDCAGLHADLEITELKQILKCV